MQRLDTVGNDANRCKLAPVHTQCVQQQEEIDPNNFEKASEDVLKTRKIVKARRGGGALASSAPPPATEGAGASNPFAGVSLVAPVVYMWGRHVLWHRCCHAPHNNNTGTPTDHYK